MCHLRVISQEKRTRCPNMIDAYDKAARPWRTEGWRNYTQSVKVPDMEQIKGSCKAYINAGSTEIHHTPQDTHTLRRRYRALTCRAPTLDLEEVIVAVFAVKTSMPWNSLPPVCTSSFASTVVTERWLMRTGELDIRSESERSERYGTADRVWPDNN